MKNRLNQFSQGELNLCNCLILLNNCALWGLTQYSAILVAQLTFLLALLPDATKGSRATEEVVEADAV